MHARHLERRLLDYPKLHSPFKDPIIVCGQQLQIIPAKDLLLLSSTDFKLLPKSKIKPEFENLKVLRLLSKSRTGKVCV